MKKHLTYISAFAFFAAVLASCGSSSEMAGYESYDGIYGSAPAGDTQANTSPATVGYTQADATEGEYQYYNPDESYEYKTASEDEDAKSYGNYEYEDEYYDYEYASRLRRFHNTTITNNYYSPWYTNSYWYNPSPWSFNYSIYDPFCCNTWGYHSSWSIGFSWGYSPWYSVYSPWYSPWYRPYSMYGYWAYNPYYNPWYSYPIYTDNVYPSDVYYGSRNGTGYTGGTRGGINANRNSAGRSGMAGEGPKSARDANIRDEGGRRAADGRNSVRSVQPRVGTETGDRTPVRNDNTAAPREERYTGGRRIEDDRRQTTPERHIQSPAERIGRTDERRRPVFVQPDQPSRSYDRSITPRRSEDNNIRTTPRTAPRRSNTYSAPPAQPSSPSINRSASPSRGSNISTPSRSSGSVGGSSRSSGGSRNSGGRR